MPFFYVLNNRAVQGPDGLEEYPAWPPGKTPGGWWGHHFVHAPKKINVWLTATRDDLGLPLVASGVGRYSETTAEFERVCKDLGQDPADVRTWSL